MTDQLPFVTFPKPFVPPVSAPHDGAQYLIGCNAEWLPLVLGALHSLWDKEVWIGDTQAVSIAQEKASQLFMLQSEAVMQVGAVFMWVNPVAPAGCLLCDGAEYDKAAYPSLWAILGETYEATVDTFYVPNLADRFPLGAGSNYGLNESGGEEYVQLTVDQIPAHTHSAGSHTHTIDDHSHQMFVSDDRVVVQAGTGQAVGTEPVQAATADTPLTTNESGGDTGSSGSDGAHNNLPPFTTVYFVIQAI